MLALQELQLKPTGAERPQVAAILTEVLNAESDVGRAHAWEALTPDDRHFTNQISQRLLDGYTRLLAMDDTEELPQ